MSMRIDSGPKNNPIDLHMKEFNPFLEAMSETLIKALFPHFPEEPYLPLGVQVNDYEWCRDIVNSYFHLPTRISFLQIHRTAVPMALWKQ